MRRLINTCQIKSPPEPLKGDMTNCNWKNVESRNFRLPNWEASYVRTKQSVTEKGKEAITKFKVIEFLGFYTYIRAYLETGRTHQIRVHFSHIKHPLVGDKTYGTSQRFAKNTSDDLKDFIIKFPRQALHARELSFIDPSSNETVNFESEIPKDFQSLLDRLKTNENLT